MGSSNFDEGPLSGNSNFSGTEGEGGPRRSSNFPPQTSEVDDVTKDSAEFESL